MRKKIALFLLFLFVICFISVFSEEAKVLVNVSSINYIKKLPDDWALSIPISEVDDSHVHIEKIYTTPFFLGGRYRRDETAWVFGKTNGGTEGFDPAFLGFDVNENMPTYKNHVSKLHTGDYIGDDGIDEEYIVFVGNHTRFTIMSNYSSKLIFKIGQFFKKGQPFDGTKPDQRSLPVLQLVVGTGGENSTLSWHHYEPQTTDLGIVLNKPDVMNPGMWEDNQFRIYVAFGVPLAWEIWMLVIIQRLLL